MKILMAGLGGIGQRHVRNLRLLKGFDVDIIAFRYRNNSPVLTDQLNVVPDADLAGKYSIKEYGDIDKALGEKPDVVFICNPSSLHVPLALKAARAGCNLFIEKPLSHNLEQVEELIEVVESQHIKAVVGYQMRFHPCLLRLYSLIQERAVGRITSVRVEVGEYLPDWHTYEDYRQMYASRKELGGGVVLTQIHELDYIYWLFGLPTRVFSIGGHLSSLEVDVEDTADILMECFVDNHLVPVSVHLDYIQRPSKRVCEIVGDAGKIIVDFRELTLTAFDALGNLSETNLYEGFDRNQLFINELKYYFEYLQGNLQSPLVLLHEAAQSLRMAFAVKESLRTGNIVELKNK